MHFDAALAALDAHYQAMPPVAAMQLRIADSTANACACRRHCHATSTTRAARSAAA
jgi:hypothetical protein